VSLLPLIPQTCRSEEGRCFDPVASGGMAGIGVRNGAKRGAAVATWATTTKSAAQATALASNMAIGEHTCPFRPGTVQGSLAPAMSTGVALSRASPVVVDDR